MEIWSLLQNLPVSIGEILVIDAYDRFVRILVSSCHLIIVILVPTIMEFNILKSQEFGKFFLRLPEITIVLEHDEIIYVPVLSALTETMEPDFIFAIDIDSE